MENVVAKMAENLLDPKAPLFTYLKENPPAWWEMLKSDPELYIDIRKGNELMIYYQGGRVACLQYHARSKKVTATVHPKYLGHMDTSDDRFYRQNSSKDPIYQDIFNNLGLNLLTEIKERIKSCYSQRSESNTQEKLIQGNLVIANRNKYIDSEFAHRQYEGRRKTVRIDLVMIENGQIIFEELKKLDDPRMNASEGTPEIVQQINDYREFISANHKTIKEYYEVLYLIKKDLGLPVPAVDISNVDVRLEPRLTIKDLYGQEQEPVQKKRTEKIKNILREASIDFQII